MKAILTILSITAYCFCFGQNLIPNGDLESYINCPTVEGLLDYASPWTNLAALSPDYYNTCSPGSAGIPYNNSGYQMPNSGDGYAGIFTSQTISGDNVREYISIPLSETLQKGTTYSLQFHVSLANYSNFSITTMGAYFSVDDILPLNGHIVNETPQIVHTGEALADTLNWMAISGLYTATGNEQYLTIGNFEDDENCNLQSVDGGLYDLSYYYIDDIVLSSPTSVQEYDSSVLSVYPNPFSGNLNITSTENQEYEVTVYDLSSRIVLQKIFLNSITVDTEKLSNGAYIYEIRNESGAIKNGKILKQ